MLSNEEAIEAIETHLVGEEPTQAAERRIADLRASNMRRIKAMAAKGAVPTPMSYLAARVRAVLAILEEGQEAYENAKGNPDPGMIVHDAIEGLVSLNTQTPIELQMYEEAFEHEMSDLLDASESEFARMLLTQPAPASARSQLILGAQR